MSLENFKTTIQEIANKIWIKYGLSSLTAPEAYEEIKSEVSFSSWMVSHSHREKILDYCDQIQNNYQEKSVDNIIFCQSISTVHEKFIGCVKKTLKEIYKENAVAYWQVRFVETKRLLVVGELDCASQNSQFSKFSEDFETAAIFFNKKDAEEAAQKFCDGYLIAGINLPQIQIIAINIRNQEIPGNFQWKPGKVA